MKVQLQKETDEKTNHTVGFKASLWYDVWKRLKKNRLAVIGMINVIILSMVAIFAPYLAPYNPYEGDLKHDYLKPPSREHPFGTDLVARDVLSRVIYGTRISLMVGILARSVSLLIGITLGAIAGYYGGIIDNIIMRLADVMFAFPSLLLAIAISVAMGEPNLYTTFLALGIVGWAGMARLVRGQVLSIREHEYIQAARALGVPDFRIIFRHILPNTLAPIIVSATIGIAGAIMGEATLSFLGLGIQPPNPSWGSMMSIGRDYLRSAPWLTIYPGIAIAITVFSFNLLGDGLRDALDPRLKD